MAAARPGRAAPNTTTRSPARGRVAPVGTTTSSPRSSTATRAPKGGGTSWSGRSTTPQAEPTSISSTSTPGASSGSDSATVAKVAGSARSPNRLATEDTVRPWTRTDTITTKNTTSKMRWPSG